MTACIDFRATYATPLPADGTIPFDLGSWAPVADSIRRDLEGQMGRAMTDVEVMA